MLEKQNWQWENMWRLVAKNPFSNLYRYRLSKRGLLIVYSNKFEVQVIVMLDINAFENIGIMCYIIRFWYHDAQKEKSVSNYKLMSCYSVCFCLGFEVWRWTNGKRKLE